MISNSTQLDIDYENEPVETEKVAQNDNDIIIRQKCYKRPKCHQFEPIQRLLSFNLSYCIIWSIFKCVGNQAPKNFKMLISETKKT